jgi:hypothetical protein
MMHGTQNIKKSLITLHKVQEKNGRITLYVKKQKYVVWPHEVQNKKVVLLYMTCQWS